MTIKKKVEEQGISLNKWNININYGLKTGLNDAFFIDTKKREELILLDDKSSEVIKPLLRGRDIQKWCADYSNLWLIYIPWHFPLHNNSNIQGASLEAESEFKTRYNAIYNHLISFKEALSDRNRAETGIRYEWYALQRFGSNYWMDFEKPKIIYPNMTKFFPFIYDENDQFYHNDKSFHIIGERLFWLVAFLNSKLFKYCFKDNFPELLGGTRELRKVFIEQIPVKYLSDEEEKPFENLVRKIIELKKQNQDTTELEKEIDQLVYKLYGLTNEEIQLVENSLI